MKNLISVLVSIALIILAFVIGSSIGNNKTVALRSSSAGNSISQPTATFDPKVDRSQIVTVVVTVITKPPPVTVDPKNPVATPTPPQGEPTDPRVIEDHSPVFREEPEFNQAKECPAPAMSDKDLYNVLMPVTFEERMMDTQQVVVADVTKEGEVFEYGMSKEVAFWYQRWHVKLVEDWATISSPAEFIVILPVKSDKQVEGKQNRYMGSVGTKLQAGKRYILFLAKSQLAEQHGYPNAEFHLYSGNVLEILGDKACPTALYALSKYRSEGIPYPQTVADIKAAIARGTEARIKLNPTPFIPEPTAAQ